MPGATILNNGDGTVDILLKNFSMEDIIQLHSTMVVARAAGLISTGPNAAADVERMCNKALIHIFKVKGMKT